MMFAIRFKNEDGVNFISWGNHAVCGVNRYDSEVRKMSWNVANREARKLRRRGTGIFGGCFSVAVVSLDKPKG